MRLSDRGAQVIITALNTDGYFTTTSNGVNMKNYNRCRITYAFTCTGAANATVTLLQGTTATATTALGYTQYLKNEDCLTYPTTNTLVAATTLTTAGPSAGTCSYIFEVKSDMLSTDTFGSECTYVRLNAAGSGGGNVTAAVLIYEMYEPRDARSGDGMPSVA